MSQQFCGAEEGGLRMIEKIEMCKQTGIQVEFSCIPKAAYSELEWAISIEFSTKNLQPPLANYLVFCRFFHSKNMDKMLSKDALRWFIKMIIIDNN